MSLSLVFACLFLALFICSTISQAEAAPITKKIIGIQISQACLKSSQCLDYRDIKYLDRSNQKISGGFVDTEGGDIERKCNGIKSSTQWYSLMRPKNLTLIVDPCFVESTAMPIITIEKQLDAYFMYDQRSVKEYTNITDAKPTISQIKSSHTRWVDAKCDQATITAKDWKRVLIDTINYLSHGCDPGHTKINTISIENRTITKHDISTSSKAKLEKYQDWVKKNCLKSRNSCMIPKYNPTIIDGDKSYT